MKLFSIIFLCILCGSLLVTAQEQKEHFNDVQNLLLKFHMDGEINIVLTEPLGHVEEMKVDLSFFPRENEYQHVENIKYDATPQAEITPSEKYITYIWEDLENGKKLRYSMEASIRTKNIIAQVTQKIPFPFSLDASYLKYTKASPFIDITPEIEQQALSIVEGEADVYAIVFKLADWTKNNVKYDLSTLTADAVQKSSWVLENKNGVCDEITNLFISMLRSLGIPAKFVSGTVYSNVDHTWGSHGWAEVYFPGVGWVPFDVTFGQYGWLDPSHLKLKDDADSGSPSTEYSWKATASDDMDIRETYLETSLSDEGNKIQPFINVELVPYKKAVAPGSVVPMLVTLENTQNVYVAPTITVTKAPGLEEANTKQVLLYPRESKTIAWLLKIPEDTAQNFIYTSTLEAVTTFGTTATNEIKYAEEYPLFRKEDAEEILLSLMKRAEKTRLEDVSFSCKPDKQIYYKEDPVLVQCQVRSMQEEPLNIKACLLTECHDITVLPRTTKDLTFSLKAETSGRFTATVESAKQVAYASIPLNVIKTPELTLTHIKPETIEYGEEVHLSFTIETDTPLYNINMDLGFNDIGIENIEESKEMTIVTSSKNLINGINIDFVYSDSAQKVYHDKKTIKINVTNVPWYAKMIFWMASFFQ